MKILPVNTINQNQTGFKSSVRIYTPKDNPDFKSFGQMVIRTSTNVFREDIDWAKLAKFIIYHFKDVPVVNAYSLAASDSSEAITYAISLFDTLKQMKLFNEYKSKFSHIFASDIDQEILRAAMSGKINLLGIEFVLAEKQGFNLYNYVKDKSVSMMIKGDNTSETDYIYSYAVIPEIRDAIKYKRSDILTELKQLKDYGNSVVMCRNVFPYLNYEYQHNIIEYARRNLKPGSLFIIGDFDNEVRNIGDKLLRNGFFRPFNDELCIFERK